MPIEINDIEIQGSIQDTLQQAFARIAQLEYQIANLQSALEVGASGEVTLVGRSLTIRADHTITIQSAALLDLRAGTLIRASAANLEGSAGSIKGNSAISEFSGLVKCDVLQANTVIGSSYTPGVGNIF